jgi:diguanylate cyclase (GGDEF)-like protein
MNPLDTQNLPKQAMEDRSWIALQQLHLLYGNASMTLFGTVLCAVALVLLLWAVVPRQALLLWFAVGMLLTLLRAYLQGLYGRRHGRIEDPQPWLRAYVAGALVSGLWWGAVSVWLFPAGAPMHQIYIAFMLSGVSAGAMSLHAAVPHAFLCFVLPALLPYVVRLLGDGSMESQLMAGTVVTFLLVLVRTARQSGEALYRVLELQVKNAALARALHHQATHDSMVDLVNHGEFQRRLERLAAGPAQPHAEFSLVFMDLDRFKAVNDGGGHAAGDALLRVIADILRKYCRATDTAARVGGDEFALLLPNCPRQRALDIGEQVRAEIEALTFRHDDRQYTIGASVGISWGRAGLQAASSLLKAADIACYTAKQEGRNRVCMLPANDLFQTTGRFELLSAGAR